MRHDVKKYAALADVQAAAFADIDDAAGRARARYITAVPGQDGTYLLKQTDATNYKAAGYPADTTGYPWVAAEAAATGATPKAVADNILATAQLWVDVLGPQIEQQRIVGKTQVRAATDVAGVRTARDAAVSALDAI